MKDEEFNALLKRGQEALERWAEQSPADDLERRFDDLHKDYLEHCQQLRRHADDLHARNLTMMDAEIERTRTAPKESGAAAGKDVWNGSDRAFGDFVLQQFQQRKIPGATSRTNALEIMCTRYVRKDGTPFKAHSIWQNLQNRAAEGK